MPQTAQKEAQRYHKTTVDTVAQYMSYMDVQHMTRAIQGVAELVILNCYEGTRRKCVKGC